MTPLSAYMYLEIFKRGLQPHMANISWAVTDSYDLRFSLHVFTLFVLQKIGMQPSNDFLGHRKRRSGGGGVLNYAPSNSVFVLHVFGF